VKRVAIFGLLLALNVARPIASRAQSPGVVEWNRESQIQSKKYAKQQNKLMKQAYKKQRKASKKVAKAQRKATRDANRRR
jgi:hypothetical protein